MLLPSNGPVLMNLFRRGDVRRRVDDNQTNSERREEHERPEVQGSGRKAVADWGGHASTGQLNRMGALLRYV